MESVQLDNIKHLANIEVVRRMLIKYFMDKGYTESFDRQLHPTLLQDLPAVLPILSNKIEVVPFAEEIDSSMGKARIGWNLFVLGNQRMYLGETSHNDLKGLARQIHSGLILPSEFGSSARRQTTPKRIITFITRVLGDSKSGYVDLAPTQLANTMPMSSRSGMPKQFISRGGGVY